MDTTEDDPHVYTSTPRQGRISSEVARAVVELIAEYGDDKPSSEAAVNGLIHALGFITGLSFCPQCERGWMAFINRTVSQLAERQRLIAGENYPCVQHH